MVTTCMANLNGMLDKDVFNNRDYAAIDEHDLVNAPGAGDSARTSE